MDSKTGFWKNAVNSSEWKDDFNCPHCGHYYDHNQETWDYVGIKGDDTIEQIHCRECDNVFSVEMCVVCVYRTTTNVVQNTKSQRPALKLIRGGRN
jgi:transcription elongation factor Elf1